MTKTLNVIAGFLLTIGGLASIVIWLLYGITTPGMWKIPVSMLCVLALFLGIAVLNEAD